MTSGGTINVVSPSTEASGVAVLAVNGNTVLHASNYSSYALPLSGGTMSGNIVMGTSGESYVRMGRFPASVSNSGETWIGRASDRSTGTMTIQLGGSTNGSRFEIVDFAWSQVIFEAGMNVIAYKGNTMLHAGNYNSYSPALTGGGASGTWSISITGSASSAGSADVLNTFFLGTGTVNTSAGSSRILRVDGGSGAQLQYSPVLHIAASDTMWQIQGTYGTSGDGTLYFRQGYAGSWGNWLTMLSSSNASYALAMNQHVRTSDSPSFQNVYATAAAGRIQAGSTSSDGILYDTSRSALVARGNYPHIEIFSEVSNANHGGTLRFTGYDNGSSGAYKSWNIGAPGSDLYFLDIAYGGTSNSNPHAGIAGLGSAYSYPGGLNLMRFHNNGNVGIGNFGTYGTEGNTPGYKLDVRGTGYFGGALTVNIGTGSGNLGVNGLYISQPVLDTTHQYAIYMYENGGQATGYQTIGWYNGNQSYFKARMYTQVGGSYANTRFILDVADNARTLATRLYFDNGSAYFSGDVVAYSSDKRLKENVIPIDDSIGKIKQIAGVYFDWKDKMEGTDFVPAQKHDVGVIAQDVQKILPEVVTLAPFDTDSYGNSKSGENYLTVKYDKLVPLLIEAIKEQQSTIEAQNERIRILESFFFGGETFPNK
jgi:hypothetical protein